MAALREAVDYLFLAIVALDLGDSDHARDHLRKGLPAAARAFPPGTPVSFALPLVYGVLIEEAA